GPGGVYAGAGAGAPDRRLAGSLPEVARQRGADEYLRDLDRVERGALAQVVADEEEHEAVLCGGVGTHATDENIVASDRMSVPGHLLEPEPRSLREDALGLRGRERRFRLDPHRLGVAHDDGNADARGAAGQVGAV